MPSFDKDAFVAECLSAVRSGDGQKAVNEIIERAVATPSMIEAEVRPWTESPMMTVWHRSDELTALHIVWPPEVDLFAHDHNMWAVIGIYGGREDNQFYRRLPNGRIEPNAEKMLLPHDTVSLGDKVVHSVANPTREWTAALHVYGGEFFTTPRTMWNKETLTPLILDVDFIKGRLEDAASRARDATQPGTRP